MALAVNTLGTSGGIAVCSEGKVIASMTLDIAGLMSVKSADEVTREHDNLYSAAKVLNITDKIDPFLSLAFAATGNPRSSYYRFGTFRCY